LSETAKTANVSSQCRKIDNNRHDDRLELG
jgi:hypothetical protein